MPSNTHEEYQRMPREILIQELETWRTRFDQEVEKRVKENTKEVLQEFQKVADLTVEQLVDQMYEVMIFTQQNKVTKKVLGFSVTQKLWDTLGSNTQYHYHGLLEALKTEVPHLLEKIKDDKTK